MDFVNLHLFLLDGYNSRMRFHIYEMFQLEMEILSIEEKRKGIIPNFLGIIGYNDVL